MALRASGIAKTRNGTVVSRFGMVWVLFDHSRASWAGSTGKLCGFFFDFSFAESLEPTA